MHEGHFRPMQSTSMDSITRRWRVQRYAKHSYTMQYSNFNHTHTKRNIRSTHADPVQGHHLLNRGDPISTFHSVVCHTYACCIWTDSGFLC